MHRISLGAKIATAFWLVAAALIWLVADGGGPASRFDQQVRARCEQLGHVFQRNTDGSLTCARRQLARV